MGENVHFATFSTQRRVDYGHVRQKGTRTNKWQCSKQKNGWVPTALRTNICRLKNSQTRQTWSPSQGQKKMMHEQTIWPHMWGPCSSGSSLVQWIAHLDQKANAPFSPLAIECSQPQIGACFVGNCLTNSSSQHNSFGENGLPSAIWMYVRQRRLLRLSSLHQHDGNYLLQLFSARARLFDSIDIKTTTRLFDTIGIKPTMPIQMRYNPDADAVTKVTSIVANAPT